LRLAVPLALALALAGPGCRRAPPARDLDLPPPPLEPAALERSAGACKDFYQYACGGWLAAAVIPADRGAWDRGTSELEERNARALRRLLEAAAGGRGDARDLASAKLGDYWASCMDGAAVDARGLAELSAAWARVDAAGDRDALVGELARLHAAGISAPFELEVEPDAKGAQETVLVLRQGGLSLPDRAHWTGEDPASAAIRARFGAHLRRMLALAAVSPAEVERQAAAVERLERALAAAHAPRTAQRDPARAQERVGRAGLAALAPGFPWALFLERLGAGGVDAIAIGTPALVTRVGALLAEAPLDDWRAYLRWRLLAAMADARALPRAFVDERFAFEGALSGATAQPPRWKHCLAEVDRALGFALGKAFVRAHFGPAAREGTARLVAGVEAAMARDLDRLAWMDAASRARAKEKLGRVVNKVGHPAAWRDDGALKVSRTAYFRNVLAARRLETARALALAGKPPDRGAWPVPPQATIVSYDPARDELLLPAGILRPPFYSPAAPDPVNYGAIGTMVGHALARGLLGEGRRGRAGNLADGWTPAVARAFEERAACLVEQYGAFEPIPGVKLDGRRTLGENVADLGGVGAAFAALQAALASRPEAEARAKLLGFTPEQQFFLAFAQSRCSAAREEELRRSATLDPRAPVRFRVNGPLSNLPEFAEAFRCEPDDPMVRPDAARCAVWRAAPEVKLPAR